MLCAKGQLAGVAATKGREKSVLQQVQAVGTVKCKPSELVAHTGVGSSYYCLSLGELGDLLLDIKRFLVFLGRRQEMGKVDQSKEKLGKGKLRGSCILGVLCHSSLQLRCMLVELKTVLNSTIANFLP